ncbi:AAA family ATPase [Microcystis elabens FACHB-917]|nr:AAA family ATPase [Microcystis elabens FACHB-917]
MQTLPDELPAALDADADGVQQIHVAGFCSLKDVVLEPGRLTLLIGPNGSGKSNLLQVLRLIPLLRTRSLQRYVADQGFGAALLHYGPKTTEAIELAVVIRDQGVTYRYDASLAFAPDDSLYFQTENAVRLNPDATWAIGSLGGGHRESHLLDEAYRNKTVNAVNEWLGRMTFYHFHDTSSKSKLRTHARREEDRYPRSDGSNLAAYLLRLKDSDEAADRKAWQRINRHCRHIAPAIKQLDPVAVNGSVRLDWIDDRDERFGCHQLSDGTLRALALITVLSQPTERLPRLISIDEPELGLHPAAIALIAELCRAISRQTQIILSTQSTELLDHFMVDEVIVVEREQGETKLKRLSALDLRLWLEDYSLRELYAKGVIGGTP